jgi:hypothetical protein
MYSPGNDKTRFSDGSERPPDPDGYHEGYILYSIKKCIFFEKSVIFGHFAFSKNVLIIYEGEL